MKYKDIHLKDFPFERKNLGALREVQPSFVFLNSPTMLFIIIPSRDASLFEVSMTFATGVEQIWWQCVWDCN